MSVRVTLELNNNDAEALLRHALQHQPDTGDFRENTHLREALSALADVLQQDMAPLDATNATS